jgi:enamine deaminase RidA (YjgF/YER057c/UK114 family)
MEKTQVNPWTWQDPFGFSQCWRVDGARSLIVVSGQSSISADGQVLHADDFAAQVRLTFENLRTVLERAGASLGDVVKLSTFLVGMEHLGQYGAVQASFFTGKMPAQTVVGVTALALPGMLVEVEALAVLA